MRDITLRFLALVLTAVCGGTLWIYGDVLPTILWWVVLIITVILFWIAVDFIGGDYE